MDDIDKKKKRNKKKKNKKTNTSDDLAAGVDQSGASSDNNEHHKLTVLANESRNGDFYRRGGDGTEICMLSEAEKQQWLHREGILKGTIRQLQHDNDSHVQKVALLEEKVKLLQVQNDSERQKQASLEETINQLRHTNYSTSQKEVTLKETIQQLKNENDIHMQNEEKLEEKIILLESARDSLTVKETVANESIASLNFSISKLRMQVLELEESRKNLMKENKKLSENISSLQLQLQNLETSINASADLEKHASEHKEKDSQIEAACALVDKLITENTELIEKVNELYIKLERQRSAAGLENVEITSGSVLVPDSGEYERDDMLEALEVEPVVEKAYDVEVDSREIIQIPLDLELQADVNDDKVQAVPLSDAPLTGAPLRLISFFTKYISGADLVNKN